MQDYLRSGDEHRQQSEVKSLEKQFQYIQNVSDPFLILQTQGKKIQDKKQAYEKIIQNMDRLKTDNRVLARKEKGEFEHLQETDKMIGSSNHFFH